MANRKTTVLKYCHELHSKYANDFPGWVRDFINFDGLKLSELTWQQKEIAYYLTKEKRVACSGGGGVGKSALAALLTLWFLPTHPHSKIPTTAPNSKQLKDILWAEIDSWLDRCKLKNLYIRRKDTLHIHSFSEWKAVARTVPRDGKNINDTLSGFHSPYLLILVDESSGVPDPVFTALDGAMTQDNSHIFMISNPVSTGGYFYDTITDPEGKGQDYKVLLYSSLDSPLVDPSYEQSIINRYGKDSPMYKSKVLGIPIGLLETALVSPEEYDRIIAENRLTFNGSIVLGVDPGGKGADPSVICHKQGRSIIKWDEQHITDDQYLADKVEKIAKGYQAQGLSVTTIVDAIGIGAGVYQALAKKRGLKVLPFEGSEKAHHTTMFKNKRAEGFYLLKEHLLSLHFPVKPPEALKKQLVNLRFDYDNGPIEMEPKKRLKSRIGMSPDHADALMLANSINALSSSQGKPLVPKASSNVFKKLAGKGVSDKYGKYKKFIV